MSEGIELREYVERLFDEREKAAELVATNLEQRLDKLNELRAEVMKDRDQFLKKDLYDQMHAGLMDRVYKLEAFQSRLIGLGTALVVGAGIISAVITKVFFQTK
jgi:hypothetical protein